MRVPIASHCAWFSVFAGNFENLFSSVIFRLNTTNLTSSDRTWERLTDAAVWPARAQHSAVSLDHSIYIHGGINSGGDAVVDFWRGSLWGLDLQWFLLAPSPLAVPTYAFSLVAWDRSLLLVGASEEIWRYSDFPAPQWTRVTDKASFSGRSFGSMVVFEDRAMYIAGDWNSGISFTNEVLTSSLPLPRSPEPTFSPKVMTNSNDFQARVLHAAAVCNNLMFILGGRV